MVTNVVTVQGESNLNISGCSIRLVPRVQGGVNCRDGYMHILIPSGAEEGAYAPAQSGTVYIRNKETALLLAQAFTELAEAMK